MNDECPEQGMEEEIKTQCPNCETGTAGQMEKQRRNDEVTVALTCDECGHEWTRVLRFE
ncbi:hypothetical protein CV102_18565 [Natronococcus pandeyae]|uniref:TFIIS-type domain-containing protein n=1 Tax=Natronococcus pandeyae TaxID=2055836 RepID=A0A8J8TNT4_9EURY|nr:hypothetical protein CV102_18565 [Natronococcus pandeyae]